MATPPISIHGYTAATTIDAVADFLLIDPASTGNYLKINRNVLLGLISQPLGLTDAQSPTNKAFGNTNSLTVKDSNLIVQNATDITKQAVFSATGITTGTTRTLTLPNRSDTLATLAGAETFTNKTLTSPVISGGSIDNATVTVDSIAGHTTSTIVTVAGVQLSNGTIATSGSVTTASIAAGAVVPNSLVASSGTGWSWQTWTPSLSNASLGNGTIDARYIQIGKLIYCRFRFTLGTSSSITGDMSITLPVTAVSAYTSSSQHAAGNIYMTPAGSAFYGIIQVSDTTHAFIEAQLASGTYVALQALSSSVPAVWAATNWMAGEFCYEAA